MLTGSFLHYLESIKSLQDIALVTDIGVPKSMGNLCNLRSLRLDCSESFFNGTLQDISESLSGCATKSLEILSLKNARVRGSLPDLSQFSSLRELHLTRNKLNGRLSQSI